MRRLRKALLALLAAMVVAACGVSADPEPRVMSPENVPFGLLNPATSTTTTIPDSGRQSTVGIYLVTPDGALVERPRLVRGTATVATALDALLDGPTREERAANLTTAITDDTRVLGLEQNESLVTVDLSRDVLSITGVNQIQAIAQVVFTITGVTSASGVLFRFDGERREVPDGDGELTAEPLKRSDFRSLR